MIKELWPGVSLENYNKWFPLTGQISVTPEKYIEVWPDVNDWFKTFALRAQNDINAYLKFALDAFDINTIADKHIIETLGDMVFVCVEHWVYNRTPIEFNSNATLTYNNNQTQFNSFATPTINIWDLHPSRMKIWANLTGLKNLWDSAQEGTIDPNLIDLNQYYSKMQTDMLLAKKADKTELPDVSMLETKDDHNSDIANLQNEINTKVDQVQLATKQDLITNNNQHQIFQNKDITSILHTQEYTEALQDEFNKKQDKFKKGEEISNLNVSDSTKLLSLRLYYTDNSDTLNLKTINKQSIIGSGDIEIKSPEPVNQFTDEEIKQLKALLANTAFGINKVTENLEQKGFFTQQTYYSDLDKPDDNLVTDNLGNDKNIRKIADHHFSGNTWRDEKGNTTLRDYQGKLTYKNDEIALKKDVTSSWIVGEYKWMPVNSKMPNGWVKVDIDKGFTLIQGDSEGTSKGEVISHYHDVPLYVSISTPLDFTTDSVLTSTTNNKVPVIKSPTERFDYDNITKFNGGKNNLAAGMFAELWQYQGVQKVIY